MHQAHLVWRKSAVLVIAALLLIIGVVAVSTIRNTTPVSAQSPQDRVSYFLKLPGIEGEATDRGHEKEIVIDSYDWAGLENSASGSVGGGGGAGKVKVNDISFKKPVDKSTPVLLTKAANGQRIHDATLSVRKGTDKQQDYLVIKLTDVLITSYKNAGDGSSETDSFSLDYSKVQVEYKQADEKGNLGPAITGGFDFKENLGL